jgi:hypothetical protein
MALHRPLSVTAVARERATSKQPGEGEEQVQDEDDDEEVKGIVMGGGNGSDR